MGRRRNALKKGFATSVRTRIRNRRKRGGQKSARKDSGLIWEVNWGGAYTPERVFGKRGRKRKKKHLCAGRAGITGGREASPTGLRVRVPKGHGTVSASL